MHLRHGRNNLKILISYYCMIGTSLIVLHIEKEDDALYMILFQIPGQHDL